MRPEPAGKGRGCSRKSGSKTLYRIVKDLSGEASSRVPITGIYSKQLKTQEEQAKRWKEHFQAVLTSRESDIMYDFRQDIADEMDELSHNGRGEECVAVSEEWESRRSGWNPG